MAGGGITYDGTVVQAPPSGDNKAQAVEIPFSDPNFLPKAANKKPQGALETANSIVGGFLSGLYSWPFDWTLCIHWILGTAGFYGPRIKGVCDDQTQRILVIRDFALSHRGYVTFRVLIDLMMNSATAREKIFQGTGGKVPRIAGRMLSGSLFSAWMASGGRYGAKVNSGKKYGIAFANFIISSWGSCIHVSLKHREFDLRQLIISILTGNPDDSSSSEEYKNFLNDLDTIAKERMESGLDAEDYALYKEFMNIMFKFGQNGGKL